ncbi:MAG TPA: radical SAM protein [Vicinamibacterales bacterium]|nr:radical SAM protein [Vicinamibacterales bacterium]
MEESPLLFDLGPRPLTTRDVARLVKHGGVEALTEAERRADHASYQEIRCRSALNRVEGMPFNWTLNPYRGCTHGCHYCFARKYQTQMELGSGDEFASLIFVKTNFVEVLTKELDDPKWRRDVAALGTATDPYQPIEGHYKLSRGALQALAAGKTPVGIVTKGPMVVRDIDVLQDLSRAASATVCVSVPSIDDFVWKTLEPGTASPMQRLRAVRALVDAGIEAGVLMNPLVPGFSTAPAKIEATVKAIADHGARFVGSNPMYLDGGTRDHFMSFLQQEFPAMLDQYDRLYAAKYLPKEYAARIQKTVAMFKMRYGIADRKRGRKEEDTPETPAPAYSTGHQATQGVLRWG